MQKNKPWKSSIRGAKNKHWVYNLQHGDSQRDNRFSSIKHTLLKSNLNSSGDRVASRQEPFWADSNPEEYYQETQDQCDCPKFCKKNQKSFCAKRASIILGLSEKWAKYFLAQVGHINSSDGWKYFQLV